MIESTITPAIAIFLTTFCCLGGIGLFFSPSKAKPMEKPIPGPKAKPIARFSSAKPVIIPNIRPVIIPKV